MNRTAEKKTRSISLILVLLMLLGFLSGLMIPADAATPFSDVPSGKWYTSAVQYCNEKGYMNGYEDGTFRPDNKLTRAEMAVIMNKMLGLTESRKNTFSDVSSGKWYTEPILRCVKAGVITGYSDTVFGTTDTLTREQGAVVLAKAFGVEKLDGRTSFADDASISKWAAGSVKAMAARGLISGMGNNQFGPKTPLTRAQMCQIIYAAQAEEPEPNREPSQEEPTGQEEEPAGQEKEPAHPDNGNEDEGSARAGDTINIATDKDGKTALQDYYDGLKNVSGASWIDVDGDEYREMVVLGENDAGNELIASYHDGNISILPLNGAVLVYSPGDNCMMTAEYEDGTYYLNIWEIRNGQWKRVIGGSYDEPEDGPALDEDGNDIFENYQWDGKQVSEEAFYTALADIIDPFAMEQA